SDHIPKIAETLEVLGRYWEAWAWNVSQVKQGHAEAAAARDRLKEILDREIPPQTLNKFNPAFLVDLSTYPLPDWTSGSEPPSAPVASPPSSAARVSFVESTVPAGLDFSYFNGDDLEIPGMKIHQTLGGGIAAFDYDGDGWPDLHFCQGARDV